MSKNREQTRIQKWMKYREEILENKNIRESLIHTNNDFKNQYTKLSSIFHNVDFLDDEKGNFLSKIDSIDLRTHKKIKDINKHLEDIINKERARSSINIAEMNYNLKKYNVFLKKYFKDEKDNIKVTVKKIDLGKKV